MSLSKLLETNEAQQLAAAEQLAPKGWERGNERIGDEGIGSTGPLDPEVEASEELLLTKAGFNPEEWVIVGDIQYREWDANVGGGEVKTLCYRKFNVKRRAAGGASIEELIELVNSRTGSPKPRSAVSGGGTHVHAEGDWQLGKVDGDGTKGTVDRIVSSIERGAASLRTAQKHQALPYAHLAFLGDCMEGFVSQGGKNAWRTELTLTEQLRLMRRLMLYAIDEYAPLVDRLTVVSVPGNHDEAVREPGMTRYDDSYAVDSLVAVQDAMNLNSAFYGHVETFVPRRDELAVTLDVNGTTILHYHGHQHRPGKHWEWWEGSAFDRRYPDAYHADIAHSAHGHHFQMDTRGDRLWIMNPAQEMVSNWWRHRTGQGGAPGALTYQTLNGKASNFVIL